MRRLLPILVVLLGLGGGIVAGFFLKPPPGPQPEVEPGRERVGTGAGNAVGPAVPDPGAAGKEKDETKVTERTYVSVGTQTIIPVVDGDKTTALMLFELAVDVDPSAHDQAVMAEPRLRDAFLRALLKMSSTGAFDETYTEDWVIDELRRNLGDQARRFLGDSLREVLVLDVIRQEL